MLKRKAYQRLEDWKRYKTKQALLVKGARQVGKTTLVRQFAADNYGILAEVNFFDNKTAKETVMRAIDADDLLLRLSVLSGKELEAGKTLVFLDEIQECGADLLTWIKMLLERTDYDYILSGSLLGLEVSNISSLPVGFLQEVTLYPLDFEEFCWASGIGKTALEAVSACMESLTPVPDYLHDKLTDTFYRYLLVGGMPDVVQAFVDNNDLLRARNLQRGIVNMYKMDMAKYVSDTLEARQVQMVYESIPSQLNSENKRFKYARLGKSLRFANLEFAFDWLEHVGVALTAFRVNEPTFPLAAHEDRNMLKLYANDVGLLTAQMMGDVDIDILNRRSSINFGSIFENVAAQEFKACGRELRYYNSSKIGEVDFVLQGQQGGIDLCEIKSGKNYRRHSALDNLLTTKNYNFEHVYVFHDGNVDTPEAFEGVTYLPIYMMGMALG